MILELLSKNIIVFSGISVVLLVIFFLITIILIAEKKLMPQGNVKILINGDETKSPTVKPGGTLLSALSAQNVFLPSACGGGGTCALCKCQIHEGGGDILPTELTTSQDLKLKKIGDWRVRLRLEMI